MEILDHLRERPGTEHAQGLSSPPSTLGDFPLSATLQVSNHAILFGCRSLRSKILICFKAVMQHTGYFCDTLSPLLHISLEIAFFFTTASVSQQGLIIQRWEFMLVPL